MADPVDIEVRIKAAKAEATLAKLNATLKITADREKQAALRTKILENRLTRAAQAGSRAGKGFKTMNIALSSFIGNITSRIVSSSITTLINGFRSVINNGREFEAGLIRIAKTTGLSDNAMKNFGKEIEDIGKRLPIATQSLLDIAVVAGQLGINGQENLTAFTETMAKLQLATDIAGEQGSQSVARILTITGELKENGTENIQKFGSVITKLGNDFAATESQILAVATSVAKGTTLFQIASEDVLALATAFKVTGSEAAISGTTIQKVFEKMGKAITKGGESLTKFAEASQLTEEEFITLFENDPTASFAKLTEGLGTAGLAGKELSAKLNDLGFVENRLRKTLAPLIVQHEVLADAIREAREEAEVKTALDIETAKAQQSLNADLQKLSNSFVRLSNVIFDKIGPALREMVQDITLFLDTLSRVGIVETFSQSVQKLLKGIQRVPLDILLMNTSIGNLAIEVGITSDSILDLADNIISLEGISRGLTGGLNAAAESTKSINERTKAQNKLTNELAEGYKDLQPEIQEFLDILNASSQGFERGDAPLLLYTKLIKGINAPLFDAADAQDRLTKTVANSTKAIILFEQDKTKKLKKFFKEEEIARLTAAFNIKEAGEEQLAFTRFVAQEGIRRRTDAFKATIGLDKATIDAERKRLAELTRMRENQGKFDDERAEEKLRKQQELSELQKDADIAEAQSELFLREGKITFEDEDFARLIVNLDREQQALIAAKLSTVDNEIEKQKLLADVRKKAAEQEIIDDKRNKQQKIRGEITLARTRAGIAGSTAELITAIAGKETKAAFLLSKAAALANIIISTQVAAAHATAQLGILAPPAVAAIELQGAIRAATVVATAITGAGNFADGGIIGGNSPTGDKLTAGVNTGEMILNQRQQKQLFNIANGQASDGTNQPIYITTQVMIDDEVVGEANSRWVANGGLVGEVQ